MLGDPVIADPSDVEGLPVQPLDPGPGTVLHEIKSSFAASSQASTTLTVPSTQATTRLTSPTSSRGATMTGFLGPGSASGSNSSLRSHRVSLEGTRIEAEAPARREKRTSTALNDDGDSQRGGIAKRLISEVSRRPWR